MLLSPHFTLAEMCRSEEAERRGLNNVPTETSVLEALKATAALLEDIRALVEKAGFNARLRVNSGYRSLEVNRGVGGVDTSDHLFGRAADIESFDGRLDNLRLAHLIRSSGLPFDQLILEYHRPGVVGSGWVHVSRNMARTRGHILTKTSRGQSQGLPTLS